MSGKFITLHDFFMFFYLFPMRKLTAVLPVKATRLISIPLVFLYSFLPVSKARRQAITETMNLVFNSKKSDKEIRKLSRQCLRNFVHTFIEDLAMNKLNRKNLRERAVVCGFEHLETALREKRGVILVGGHFTGDRLAKLFLREIGYPVLCVRIKSPVDPEMSFIARKYFFPVMVSSQNDALKDSVFIEDKGFGIEILKQLRQNGLVSILFDARRRASAEGIHCSFLGRQRFFPTNFLHIAQLTGAAVIPMLCVGNSLSFTITFGERFELKEFSDKEEFIAVNINRLVTILESQLLQYPTHWLLRK
jgi:lauroyl/myristoyl acyltransferase